METKLANKFSEYLVRTQIINADYYDIYVYGMELLLSFITSTLITIVLGVILGKTIQTLIFLSIFILLRRFTGGYHAKTYLKCKLMSILTYIITLCFSELFDMNVISYVLLGVIGFVVIAMWGPIENPNKPLTKTEKIKCKKISLTLFTILVVIGAVVDLYYSTANIIYFSLLSVIILMIISITSKKGEANNEENCKGDC